MANNADYRTPTPHSRVTPVEGEKSFGKDPDRLSVHVRSVGACEVFLGEARVPSLVLRKDGTADLPRLYVGPFRIVGNAAVTEILIHSAGG